MWRKGDPSALLAGMQTGAATVENSVKFPQNLKMELPYDPETPLLGIYTKEPKTLTRKNISIPMRVAMLFPIAKIWKQPKCPSIDE